MKNCPSLPPSCRNPAHSKPLTKIQRIHHFISKGASKASYKYTFWSLSESAASLEPDHYISRVSFLACPCCFKELSSLKHKCQMWPYNNCHMTGRTCPFRVYCQPRYNSPLSLFTLHSLILRE